MQQQLVHLDFLLVSERCLTYRGTKRRSVNIGQYAVGHSLAVLLPGQAVLPLTLVLIPGFAVDKQHSEVDDVEVRQEVVKPTWEGPGQSHDEITQVIGMANKAPPS